MSGRTPLQALRGRGHEVTAFLVRIVPFPLGRDPRFHARAISHPAVEKSFSKPKEPSSIIVTIHAPIGFNYGS